MLMVRLKLDTEQSSAMVDPNSEDTLQAALMLLILLLLLALVLLDGPTKPLLCRICLEQLPAAERLWLLLPVPAAATATAVCGNINSCG
jgi:hypothetical protein